MFLRSIVVGLVGLFINLLLLYWLVDVININYWISANIAFIIVVLINFVLQKTWSFQGMGDSKGQVQFVKFATLSLFNFLANALLIYLFVSLIGVWYLLAQFVITGLLFLLNFTIYRYYIFV